MTVKDFDSPSNRLPTKLNEGKQKKVNYYFPPSVFQNTLQQFTFYRFSSLTYMTAEKEGRYFPMDQVFIEEVVKQIGNLGFPALIAMYLLTRFEKKFDQLIELMTELKDHAKK
ncbi:YvrJ [Bacillus subtilis subsp. subtilis 6051-HGW]|uniref:Uncharacterized protein YvrJ n=7 Tax=Bacilli TaxID=91061 RepID=YVRJ_BACSU|nr:YvrJ family protein [Bacillus subtilis]YP_003097788.1 factor involved in oxalate decarboxylase expression [Bacillus subtilis subsp. subtilis str. 168]C0H3R5.1 RecName: Full=Uncharacterized protein YvrJ [Bacillus subtilis subsp. subtilis str. 168]AFQ59175.1 YvrJ [Bacillus subtilis QB928]AGG62735.1 YvrJ [Bacillus subtilis subsp. subtilis 6051-HGW]AWX22901.1 YvrJ family protein [Bacillus subtilis subsp. subtilis]KAA0934075.1 YvrJ family protein [Bacillus sp. ANT_WA51]MDR4255025.1 YvrJ family